MPPSPQSLLKIQIGPVQEFIAAARSTRDLWSGSYMLSWLMAAGIVELRKQADENALVFPAAEGQPLIEFREGKTVTDKNGLLTPNLPNLFVARVPAERAQEVAKAVENAIRAEWKAIADSVRTHADDLLIGGKLRDFDDQVARFLSVAWVVTPLSGNYDKDYETNARMLAAVRETRDFAAAGTGLWTHGDDKDSLTGKDAAIAGGPVATTTGRDRPYDQKVAEKFRGLFKHDDHLGAVSLIKRIWHRTYLDRVGMPAHEQDFPMPNTRDIAAGRPDENTADEAYAAGFGDEDDKYFAVLALDGDQIGKWISGEFTDKSKLKAHHRDFSAALSDFALGRARKTVEAHKGRLIYAGGDDVLALLPAKTALACAAALRSEFEDATKGISGKIPQPKEGETPSTVEGSRPGDLVRPRCSVGIAIGHFKAPLQDMVREAQRAEKRAKNAGGRNAFAFSLMKRSGEILHWHAKWKSDAHSLHAALVGSLSSDLLSSKWPHRFEALLSPYLTQSGAELATPFTSVSGFDAKAVALAELPAVMERQRGEKWDRAAGEALKKSITDYIQKHPSVGDALLSDLIGLCRAVAFAAR